MNPHQQFAYDHPLSRAAALEAGHFREYTGLDRAFTAVALSLNR